VVFNGHACMCVLFKMNEASFLIVLVCGALLWPRPFATRK
jgi:hypothetical protein